MIRSKFIVPAGAAYVALSALMAGSAAANPSPIISAISTSGMAPFTVHVHGLASSLGSGNENAARFEWTFGDGGSQFNTLVGWNAAHTYNQPGTYTITLKVINQLGQQASKTQQITVSAANRSTIYVSPTGNDSNAGTSIAAPVQTFHRATQLLANNRQILFQRGATFNTTSTMTISQNNVIIGAYGTGSEPIINFTSNSQYAKMIQFDSVAQNVVMEHLRFDSDFAPDNLIVRGVQPAGTNLTVRNCFFNKVSYALNCGGGGVNGLLVQNNWAGAIGAYFVWGEGANHTYIGNTVLNSTHEHNIRIGGVSKFNIAHNDFTNTAKSCIWCMLGDHAYIAHNILRSGRMIAGPNFAVGSASERFQWLVFEANKIFDAGVILYSGAENMMFRNNIISFSSGECFSIWGYLSTQNRTCTNITVANNTGINHSSQYGKFMKLGSGAVNVVGANNLYCAPLLNQPNGAGNVICDDPGLNGHTFKNNLWAHSVVSSYVHSTSTGSKTASQWSSYSQTIGETYRSFSVADLNALYVPSFNANVAVPFAGVHTDHNDNQRPATGVWTAGAIELNTTPGGNSADVNGDGVVGAADLLAVIMAWGVCANPGNCPADINSDGLVNSVDLLAVMNNWG